MFTFLFQNNCLAPYTCVGEHFVYSMKKTFSLKLGKNVGGFFIRIGKKNMGGKAVHH